MKMRVRNSEELAAHAFRQIALESEDGAIASLTLYDNPTISYQGRPTMLFGDLQLPEGNDSAWRALFHSAEDAARRRGMHFLLGPMNGSTWHQYRLPLQDDEPLFTGDSAAPSAWVRILQDAGYTQADTYRSSLATLYAGDMPQIPEGISFRTITPESLSDDLHALYPLCTAAFAQAPYFSPISEAGFIAQYEAARPLLGSGLSSVALYHGRPVAFALAYADLLHPERKAVVIKTVARHPDARIPGLIKSIMDMLYYTALQKGYRAAIHAFMHDANRSVQWSEEFGGRPLRRYALFIKEMLHADR